MRRCRIRCPIRSWPALQLIVALQTLVSRESPPLEPAVLTIRQHPRWHARRTSFRPASSCRARLRVFDRRCATSCSSALHDAGRAASRPTFRLEAEVRMTDVVPGDASTMPAWPTLVARSRRARRWARSTCPAHARPTGADDMSLFLNAVPGCYLLRRSAQCRTRAGEPAPQPDLRLRRARAGHRRAGADQHGARVSGARMTDAERRPAAVSARPGRAVSGHVVAAAHLRGALQGHDRRVPGDRSAVRRAAHSQRQRGRRTGRAGTRRLHGAHAARRSPARWTDAHPDRRRAAVPAAGPGAGDARGLSGRRRRGCCRMQPARRSRPSWCRA